MTALRQLMGISGNKIRFSTKTPNTVNGQDPDFQPLPPRKNMTPLRYAKAVSPIHKALNSKLS